MLNLCIYLGPGIYVSPAVYTNKYIFTHTYIATIVTKQVFQQLARCCASTYLDIPLVKVGTLNKPFMQAYCVFL